MPEWPEIEGKNALFTGIIEQVGTVRSVNSLDEGKSIVIDTAWDTEQIGLGASIAINGCCLTVVERKNRTLTFEAGPETLSRTNLGGLAGGDRVNLERGLVVGDRLDGHLVSGHIDGTGTLIDRTDNHDWSDFRIEVPPELTQQMASKGSVAVDGVSLTLVEVTDSTFTMALIPHTLANTTLGQARTGDTLNIETDILAKYVQRQLKNVPRRK